MQSVDDDLDEILKNYRNPVWILFSVNIFKKKKKKKKKEKNEKRKKK